MGSEEVFAGAYDYSNDFAKMSKEIKAFLDTLKQVYLDWEDWHGQEEDEHRVVFALSEMQQQW